MHIHARHTHIEKRGGEKKNHYMITQTSMHNFSHPFNSARDTGKNTYEKEIHVEQKKERNK
jgi:hypothetical protein